MMKMNIQFFAETNTGVVGRHQHADYIDVTGGSDSPQFELM